MSLWHTDDWYDQRRQEMCSGKWWLRAYLDDASRCITGYDIIDKATTENAISVLERSIERYGKPFELQITVISSMQILVK